MACVTGGHDVFIQVIHGTCTRQDELRAVGESWREELGEGATGWLGGTFGFTEENDFFAIVRFESREAAMANSQRPEQGEWASRLAELLEGAPAFYDCDDVSSFLEGGSDEAGFVQVIRGQTDDATPIKAMLADPGDLKKMRPEIIGGTFALASDGTFFETVYFTDEESARKGEGLEPPTEVREALEAMMANASFYDLHKPWFESP
jgi:hypothetical protein